MPSIWRKPVAMGAAGLLLVAASVGFLAQRDGTADSPSGGHMGVFAPDKATVTGTFVLSDYETAQDGCFGDGGYSDISPGVSVILTNESNVILGSTVLGTGTTGGSSTDCTYNFSIPDVPKDQAQYAVEVSHRGKVVQSREEMVADSWSYSLSMG